MRLRFLGTGTSSGVPVIGCSCAVCTSTDPRDNRTRTSATLEFTDHAGQDRVILIDASADLRQQALAANLERVDAILITHDHVDHIFGLDEVRRFNVLMDAPIEVYADALTHESLRRVYPYILARGDKPPESFVATLIPRHIAAGEPFDLFGLTVTPLDLMHGRRHILGFRFDDHPDPHQPLDRAGTLLPLAYATDCSAVPDTTWPNLSGLRTLALDALRHKPHPSHMTIDQACETAARTDASRTYLIHMTHDLGHAQTQAALPGGVMLAHDQLVVT
jgi:phosphoribosyl 1,2-cyclic phosphate phosphodiesterase